MNYPEPADCETFIDNMRWRSRDSILIAYIGKWRPEGPALYLFKTKKGRYFIQREEDYGTRIFIDPIDLGEAITYYTNMKPYERAFALLSFDEAFPDGIPDA